MRRLAPLLFAAVLAPGCAGGEVDRSGFHSRQDLGTSTIAVNQPAPDGRAEGRTLVFAHSADALFRIDPQQLTVNLVGLFVWPSTPDDMTDIAIDRAGRMIGISFTQVYAIDPRTAVCTRLASLEGEFNGLSFISTDGTAEDLLATGLDGSVHRLDPSTGKPQLLGSYGGGLTSSGDLVSVRGLGTLATVKKPGSDTDWLARVDPGRGQATLIGDTGQRSIWGIGFWRDRVFGFTEDGLFVLIDPKSGKASAAGTNGLPWWGAGVTTEALVSL